MPIPIAFRFGKVLARDAWMHSHFHFLGGKRKSGRWQSLRPKTSLQLASISDRGLPEWSYEDQ
jgi:hypothetical protein